MKMTDTRPLFRPLCADIVSLFRSLSADQWERPTVAGRWRVRDLAAHMLDTALRRLSYQRDQQRPASPSRPIGSDRDLVAWVNELNRTWVAAAERLSPRVLTDLYANISAQLCAFVEGLPDDAPALFPVSWAGEEDSAGWFDIGREFTEIWHHGAQAREAVGAGLYPEPAWLRAVIEISLHALPHAYRDVAAQNGTSVLIEIAGPAGGTWTLRRVGARWAVGEAPASRVDATV
ncbi:MAG TPA: maleylpyruvate isomerase N-terminal domain-containing protein, partial [Bryobacteraceae bacterium]|nr:maleylpyruvate isomerase N-terminal domain-containing protein [Bryobacteraceae bacterium]